MVFELVEQHSTTPSCCMAAVLGLAAEFLKYDVRACKYEQLCAARSEPKTSNLQFFNSLFEHAEVVTHLLENSRGLVLLRACEALEAVVSSNPTPEVLDQVRKFKIME